MDWQIGQKLICDRNGQLLTDCVVQAKDHESIVIFCASSSVVVCGKQKNLEDLGWQIDAVTSTNPSSVNQNVNT
ncbi:hypothetical protein H6G89_23545 [Oscillatoria sp. FACHB-1407]|uniref:hypothetical protein n=1 Tax=Oscillatoria sp. FACHB-1407 TaxID=2692847 RepID=UPI001683D7A9|nr:hypothetical protein [Oscillatoria sp. FACHB-1407]MBD2463981.1 hypothetical protein [Oscillatoria sp. FACHB-1407]